LAGIVVVQMIREGTPVIYGCQSTSADMRTGGYAIGCPEHALCVTCGAELARFYGLPCRGGGSPTDAKRVSVQSGYESMMVMMATCQAKIDIIMHSAGILEGHAAMSYDQFVIDLEIIGMIRRFMRGIHVDDDSLALEVIKDVGSAGQFLTNPHTFRHCRSEFWTPEISLRGAVSGNEADEKIMARIQKKQEKMLSGYQKPRLPGSVESSLHSYLKDKGLDPHLLAC
ncbi:MAG: trimethylamine methyltransferase family protein, partial [Deltaproteobacteria bacterium]|nr:trimethylamine methyltransferase family protein [Deltaproteobacteria bacterium]